MATRRLLIVDDDPAFREVARALLDGETFRVVGEAETASAGLAEAARLRPEVVLLDVRLPDVSGFEVCPALVGGGADVVLSSIREAADYGPLVERCGARGFVPKRALSVEELLRVLDG
ncbi:response regulator [Streptosporangium sp. OZ121]|uniref:response regulator n=1 Tax=unclassified Streptosporangium TaxID=2632669 RepID=UPI003F7B1681